MPIATTTVTVQYAPTPEPGKDAWYIVCDTSAITTRREVDRTISVSVQVAEGEGYLSLMSSGVQVNLSRPSVVSSRISVGAFSLADNNKRITFPVTYTAGDDNLDTALTVSVQRLSNSGEAPQTRSLSIPFTTVDSEAVDAWYIVCDTPAITTRREVDRTVDVSVRVAEGDGYLGIQSGNPYARVSLLPFPGTEGRISVGSGTRSDNNKMITFPVTYTAGDTDLDTALMVVVQRHETTTGDEQMRSQRIPFTTVARGDRGSRAAIIRVIDWTSVGTSMSYPFTFYPGAEGDAYEDYAIYRDSIYKCKKTYTKMNNLAPTHSLVKEFFEASQLRDFFATKVFFAMRSKINNLFVDDIEIVSDNGETYLYADKNGIRCRNGIFNNVQIISGNPEGARLVLTPGSADAAGGMNIYDDENKVAACYTADEITEPTNVFNGSQCSRTFSLSAMTATIANSAFSYGTTRVVEQAVQTFADNKPRIVTFEEGHKLTLSMSTSYKQDVELGQDAECDVYVYFNGTLVGSGSLRLAHLVGSANTGSIDIPLSGTYTTVPGTNTLSVEMVLRDYNCWQDGVQSGWGNGSATLGAKSLSLTATAPTKIAHYFRNGIVIGTSASNYFATYINGSETKHEMLAGSWGLQVSTAGIKFRDPTHGTWTKLKLTADN